MSKESMARITSPEAKAKRKADPWTLAKREAYLIAQTNEDVSRKREIFSKMDSHQKGDIDSQDLPF